MSKTLTQPKWYLNPFTSRFWFYLFCSLGDLDVVATILLYHAPSIFINFALGFDATVFPVFWFALYHMLGHGAWIPALSLVGSFWLPYIPKYWIARERPFAKLGWEVRGGDGFKGADKGSMPSGHACFLTVIFINLYWSLYLFRKGLQSPRDYVEYIIDLMKARKRLFRS